MNEFEIAHYLSGLAGIINAASFIPQLLSTYRTKKADDISFIAVFIRTFSLSLFSFAFFMFGGMFSSFFIGISATICFLILIGKIRWGMGKGFLNSL